MIFNYVYYVESSKREFGSDNEIFSSIDRCDCQYDLKVRCVYDEHCFERDTCQAYHGEE